MPQLMLYYLVINFKVYEFEYSYFKATCMFVLYEHEYIILIVRFRKILHSILACELVSYRILHGGERD